MARPSISGSALADSFALREAGLEDDDDEDDDDLEEEAEEAVRDSEDDRPTLGDVAGVQLKPNQPAKEGKAEPTLTELLAQRVKEDPALLDRILGRKVKRKKKAPRVRPEVDALPPSEWLALAKSYPDDESRALAALLLLCGPRITEALSHHARDELGRLVLGPDKKPVMAGFTRKDFWAETVTDPNTKKTNQFVVFRFTTLKRGDGKPRANYVLADVEPERSLLELFLRWAQAPERSKPGSRIFRFSRQNARNVLASRTLQIGATRLNHKGQSERITIHDFHPHPHWLRHCRLTDLSERYGFNEQQQRTWAGWKGTSEASRYTHLQSVGLATAQANRIGQANRNTSIVLIEPPKPSEVESGHLPDEPETDEGDEVDQPVRNDQPLETESASVVNRPETNGADKHDENTTGLIEKETTPPEGASADKVLDPIPSDDEKDQDEEKREVETLREEPGEVVRVENPVDLKSQVPDFAKHDEDPDEYF